MVSEYLDFLRQIDYFYSAFSSLQALVPIHFHYTKEKSLDILLKFFLVWIKLYRFQTTWG